MATSYHAGLGKRWARGGIAAAHEEPAWCLLDQQALIATTAKRAAPLKTHSR
jgi:hypothetical protein